MLAGVSFGEYSRTFVDIVGRQRHSHTTLVQRQARAALNPGAAPTINTEFAMLFPFGCMVYGSQKWCFVNSLKSNAENCQNIIYLI